MQTEKNKKIGVGIMIIAAMSLFFFFWYFKLDGVITNFSNPSILIRYLVMLVVSLSFFYLGLHIYGGKKLANQIGGGLAILMIVALLFRTLLG